jgi:hypothetical protein
VLLESGALGLGLLRVGAALAAEILLGHLSPRDWRVALSGRAGPAGSHGILARAAAVGRGPAIGMQERGLPAARRPVDDPTGFGPGGRALRTGPGVDVGQRISIRDRIEFED